MNNYYIEIACHQENKAGKLVCGDVFLSKKIKEENKSIAVLSDGLGSGVKANILATMTASMALNFTLINEPVTRTAKTIMNTLPVDAERQINYSTFTILNIDNDGETRVVEYDNPPFFLIREQQVIRLQPKKTIIDSNGKDKTLLEYHFMAQKEDRIIILSDGITQSGIGSNEMPFGWADENAALFIKDIVQQTPDISAHDLSRKVLEKAKMLDGLKLKDDASCAVVYFRAPRKLLICSGPPYKKESDKELCRRVRYFDGMKILCGGTTAQIVSRELNVPIETSLINLQSELPPPSTMKGIDLVTEGILTIGKVVEILENDLSLNDPRLGVAADIVKCLLSHDAIQFLVGTKVNNAHQDPSLPVELEIRRSVLKKMATLLENKFLKEVKMDFI